MINRRSFLLALAAQPLVFNMPLRALAQIEDQTTNHTHQDASEYIVLGGWTLLKNDLVEMEN